DGEAALPNFGRTHSQAEPEWLRTQSGRHWASADRECERVRRTPRYAGDEDPGPERLRDNEPYSIGEGRDHQRRSFLHVENQGIQGTSRCAGYRIAKVADGAGQECSCQRDSERFRKWGGHDGRSATGGDGAVAGTAGAWADH